MRKNIGYHTRLISNPTVKVTGGVFGGDISMDTVERLVKAHFSVKILESGQARFVDKKDREVYLYISVDPLSTAAGKEALTEYRKERQRKQEDEVRKREEIESILDGMTLDEILAKLRS